MVTATALTGAASTDDTNEYTTAEITPSANKLVLMSVVVSRGSSSTPPAPTISGCGLTWVQVRTNAFDIASITRYRLTLFRAMGASPTTGALTITVGSGIYTSVAWSVSEFGNVLTGGTNGSAAVIQHNGNAAAASNNIDVSLSEFADAGNAVYGCFGADGNVAVTHKSEYTELHDVGTTTPAIRIQSQFLASPDVSPSWSIATTNDLGAIAIEIGAAPVLGGAGRTLLGVG